jgi:hypothetical protein
MLEKGWTQYSQKISKSLHVTWSRRSAKISKQSKTRRLEDSIAGPAVVTVVPVSQIGVQIRTGDNLWAWDGCRGSDWWENASLVAPRHVGSTGNPPPMGIIGEN